MVKYWVSTEKSVKVSCECENQDARYTKGYYASCNIRRPLEWLNKISGCIICWIQFVGLT